MSRFRDIKRRVRGDLHREMSVPALYILAPDVAPVTCSVRVWLKTEAQFNGALQGFEGAQLAEAEDRIRFDITEIPEPQRTAVVSVEPGEAYLIDYLYPADLGYQTARVTRMTAAAAAGLPVPP